MIPNWRNWLESEEIDYEASKPERGLKHHKQKANFKRMPQEINSRSQLQKFISSKSLFGVRGKRREFLAGLRRKDFQMISRRFSDDFRLPINEHFRKALFSVKSGTGE